MLLPLLTSGQTTNSNYSEKYSQYFPKFTFDCNTKYDNVSNKYWSGYLTILKKLKLYKDTTYTEFYRLLYYGHYIAIVEIYKNSDKYIVIADSLDNNNKVHRYIDTLTSNTFEKESDSLNALTGKLFKMRSYEHCTQDNGIPVVDDRDNWVIEIKKGNKYHAINRIVADSYVTNFITLLMDSGQLKGYAIYFTSDKYKEY